MRIISTPDLWASTAVFHWSCFVVLMKEQGERAAEDATCKTIGVTEADKQMLRAKAAIPDTERKRRNGHVAKQSNGYRPPRARPGIRYTPTGLPVVAFSVATHEACLDKEGKRQERAEWHPVVVVGKLAMTCNEYLK